MSIEVISGILSSALVILSSVAIQFKNSAKAQRKALKELRDRDIKWAIYAHNLRSIYALETGKQPPEIPVDLLYEYAQELLNR